VLCAQPSHGHTMRILQMAFEGLEGQPFWRRHTMRLNAVCRNADAATVSVGILCYHMSFT
jgi:hypothetical protein